jgi:nucleoside-diphosphate-sugar epimerase
MTGAILVTGATGFVGRALLDALPAEGRPLVALVRRWTPELPPHAIQRIAGPIEALDEEAWLTVLEGVEVVVHLAAIAHIGPGVPESAYDAVNHRAVRLLGEAAVRAKVRRIVFMSSIRAQTGASATVPLDETTPPAPTDPYGRAKLAAEIALRSLPLESVILRPTLIVGAPAKGNLALLLKLAASGIPLPFAGLRARRSLISLEDVVAVAIRALDDSAMAGGTFILADPSPASPGEMIAALRRGMAMSPRLAPFPAALLRLPFALMGRTDIFERLGGALEARPEALLRLGWSPRTPALQALRELAARSRSADRT